MTHKGTVTLETERLILRTLRETDFDAVHAYMSDERIKRLMYYEPNTPDDTRKLIADSISNDSIFEFGVVRKDTAMLIGNIGLYIGGKEAGGDDEAEIGWLINYENQRLGFATESAKAIVKFAFEQLGLRRIIAHCDSENTASWNIMEKLGMRREAHYKKSRKSNSVLGHIWRDAFGYAILAEDYFNPKSQSSPSPHFTDICLITNDVLRLRSFYEAIFGVTAEGDEIHSGISIDGLTLVFDHVDIAEDNPAFRYVKAGSANNVIVGFNVDDVDAEYRRLLTLGVEMLNEPTTHLWGARSFQFCDPDGNILNFRTIPKGE